MSAVWHRPHGYNSGMVEREGQRRRVGAAAESGADVTIRRADYVADCATIRAIRFEVFVDEQHVPPEIEADERDAHSVHLLALAGNIPIATARIDLEYGGKIGRLAVRASWRRRGVGRALMQRCHDIAAANGLASVWCNAQDRVLPFYTSLGYRVTGDVFEEAGIHHHRMTKALATGA